MLHSYQSGLDRGLQARDTEQEKKYPHHQTLAFSSVSRPLHGGIQLSQGESQHYVSIACEVVGKAAGFLKKSIFTGSGTSRRDSVTNNFLIKPSILQFFAHKLAIISAKEYATL